MVSSGSAREEGDATPKRYAIKSYKDLDAWLMAMALAEGCYRDERERISKMLRSLIRSL
jgi:hypothetical protein